MLSSMALRGVAWSPTGIFFGALTQVMDGKPQILFYEWGETEPTLLVGPERLKGYPRTLYWDQAGARLLYADDEGLKAVSADGAALGQIQGPTVPVSVKSNVFDPGASRYITIDQGELVLSTLGKPKAITLESIGSAQLVRVAWAGDGQRVAVELTGAETAERQIIVIEAPPNASPRVLRRVAGSMPVLFDDDLYYLASESQYLTAVPLAGGDPRQLLSGAVRSLSVDWAGRRLLLVLTPQEQPPGRVFCLPLPPN